MEKIVVAMVTGDQIIGCDVKGEKHVLPKTTPTLEEWFVSEQYYNSLQMSNRRYCSAYDIAIVDEAVFNLLCQRLKQQDINSYHVVGICAYHVEMSKNFTVNLKGDRWYCEWVGCNSHNHYNCEHARYVNKIVPMEAVTPRTNPNEDYSQLIETY